MFVFAFNIYHFLFLPHSSLNLSFADAALMDPNSSDHVIAIQKLHDQIEANKKQLLAKDMQLKEKELKVKYHH